MSEEPTYRNGITEATLRLFHEDIKETKSSVTRAHERIDKMFYLIIGSTCSLGGLITAMKFIF